MNRRSRLPRAANLALWTMLVVMGVGVAVVSIAYGFLESDPCLALRTLCIGFVLVGVAPIAAAGVAIRGWRGLGAWIRAGVVVLVVWGIAFIALTFRLATLYDKCW